MTEATATPESVSAPRGISWFAAQLRDHAGLLVTLTYILLIVIGLLYEALLFLRFRINVLRVDLTTGGSVTGPLIGSTSQFIFVWEPVTRHTRIIRVENLAQIAVFRTTRQEKQPAATPPVAVQP